MEDAGEKKPRWWKKLGWLILIWAASVLSLAVITYMLRLLMRSIGLSAA